MLNAIGRALLAPFRYLDAVGRLRLALARARSLNLTLAARIAAQSALLAAHAERTHYRPFTHTATDAAPTPRRRPAVRLPLDSPLTPAELDGIAAAGFDILTDDPIIADAVASINVALTNDD